VNPDVNGYNKTRNHRKTLRKTHKTPIKGQQNTNINIKVRWGRGCYI